MPHIHGHYDMVVSICLRLVYWLAAIGAYAAMPLLLNISPHCWRCFVIRRHYYYYYAIITLHITPPRQHDCHTAMRHIIVAMVVVCCRFGYADITILRHITLFICAMATRMSHTLRRAHLFPPPSYCHIRHAITTQPYGEPLCYYSRHWHIAIIYYIEYYTHMLHLRHAGLSHYAHTSPRH